MKILLLGEFSGFYSNLKDGLIDLGHEVVLLSHSDNLRKIQNSDISLDPKLKGFLGKIENRIRLLITLSKLKNFDVVQLINPFIFYYKFFPKKYILKKIQKHNKKFYLSAAGTDAFYFQISSKILRYGPFEDILRFDIKKNTYVYKTKNALNFNKNILDFSDGIIPNNFEYECGYANQKNLKSTIPMPINTSKYQFSHNNINGKIVIFHGYNSTRKGIKGSNHIQEAFKMLEKKYSNKVLFLLKENLSFDKYLKLLPNVNIVVDQTNSYSAGMNALIAMSFGRVVLSGAEPESLKSLKIKKTPVINIFPSAKSIIAELDKLINNQSLIKKIGFESRQFVEKNHDHILIAKKYLDIWKNK
tara:strand:+ start:607 stop:1683 length:1077 start_codon:yes stop_codon:yes gene_type:complete